MPDWSPSLSPTDRPRYLALANALARDIEAGILRTGDRLPPQRELAKVLDIDFTTVARGYVEAQKRGLIASRVGQGSFVLAGAAPVRPDAPMADPSPSTPERILAPDMSMNLPPEPDDATLIARMQAGMADVARDIVALMRYQRFGGAPYDKDAATVLLGRRGLVPSQERLFICPGTHAALFGIISSLTKPGDTILSESITYPGIRSLTAQANVELHGLPMDDLGIDPDAFAAACKQLSPKALYLNPTLQNPTTLTIPHARRVAIATIARRYGVPIIEDDAYGFIPMRAESAFASVAPDVTWHISGLAKCLGPGLRLAYVIAPDTRSAFPFAAAMRSASVMASPITVALATRWINDGTADALLRFVRQESALRQQLAKDILPHSVFRPGSTGFHLWIALPEPWTRSAFAGHMRTSGLGVVGSDAFCVDPQANLECVRVGLGGPTNREQVRQGLEFMAHALNSSPAVASTLF